MSSANVNSQDHRDIILVVDDDSRSREIVGAYLRPSYRVLEAHTGATALELLGNAEIDLILLDVMMPGVDGFDTCKEVKSRTRDEFLPVLLLTALSEQEHRNVGLGVNADDFLTKPVDRSELLLRVRAFLEIRRQQRTIRSQLAELQRLQALKDELVSLIIHDVRNPLQNLLSHLHLMRQYAENQDIAKLLWSVNGCFRSAQRLEELLTDALEVRLLEESTLSLKLAPTRLLDVASAAVVTLEEVARRRNVTVHVDVDLHVLAAFDGRLLRRAIENILANALSYSPAGTTVTVSGRASDQDVEMEIADRGPGVPDRLKRRIFEKFGTVEPSQPSAERRSHGLGLYFVQLVLQAHGGSAMVRDRQGGGSIFRLTFPTLAVARETR
jgi:signal transduction histidine kinase